MSQTLLRLAHALATLRPTAHNGPGWRIGIWVQGCRLLCTDRCLNPSFLAVEGGYQHEPAEVAGVIVRVARSDSRPVEGITVLGGEPTEQAEAPVPLLHSLLRHRGVRHQWWHLSGTVPPSQGYLVQHYGTRLPALPLSG